MELAELRSYLYHGTIAAGGTLTAEMDIGGASVYGLLSNDGNFINSTLSFQVSHIPDAEGGFYVDVKNELGTILTVVPAGVRFAVSGDKITQILAPYRYVKIKTSVTQTTGVLFELPAKP